MCSDRLAPGEPDHRGGEPVPQPINDHFFLKYRELLDAEDAAFDELEHASEEGDRPHFETEMAVWREALAKKLWFLANAGIEVSAPASVK
jgi:hypothetical protein